MIIRISLILLSLSFSGCSLLYSYSDDLPNRINQWITEDKYNVALNTISYIKPDHKQYKLIQRKKNIILKQVIAYKRTTIEKSNLLADQGNWIMALELLDTAESNITNTSSIIKQRSKILNMRAKVITSYENDVLNGQANYLADKMPLYKKINKTVYKDENNELDISKFDNLRQETSIKLRKRSEQQYKKGQYDNALTTIKHALKLKPDDDTVDNLSELKKRISKATKRKKSSYLIKIKTLLNKLSQGYSHTLLKETKDTITWINKIKGNETIYLKFITKLKKHLATGMKQKFEAARKLYSEGKTQEALSIWSDLKEIDPEYPKLQSHIQRAEKVISKLKKLKAGSN